MKFLIWFWILLKIFFQILYDWLSSSGFWICRGINISGTGRNIRWFIKRNVPNIRYHLHNYLRVFLARLGWFLGEYFPLYCASFWFVSHHHHSQWSSKTESFKESHGRRLKDRKLENYRLVFVVIDDIANVDFPKMNIFKIDKKNELL